VAEKVSFDLVSPARQLFTEAVDMVVVPGSEGDFGVLPDHAPLISSIRPGVISVYQNSAVTERIFVAGGFAEVSPEGCTVLAEEALAVADIDRAAVEAELSDLRDDLKETAEPAEQADITRRIAIAEAKIAAAE